MDITMKRILYLLVFLLSFSRSYSQPEGIELSHYLFPEFTDGVILMKSGLKIKTSLNFNALSEEMIFEKDGKKLAIGKNELELVDTVYIKDRKFISLNNKFFELLYHLKCDLYAEHKCSLNEPGKPAGYGGTTQTTATQSYSSIIAGGVIYDLKLPDGYKIKPYIWYWLKKTGELNKVINMKQLMKLYDDRKDLFKAYVKKNNVEFNNQKSIIQLIDYLEGN
jgi:hypothetical protein